VLLLIPTAEIPTHAVNFLPSLTVSHPYLWEKALKKPGITFIDGVEWSLVCEVLFYLMAGIFFSLARNRFYLVWLSYTILLIAAHFFSAPLPRNFVLLFDIFFNPQYVTFFTIGIYCYNIWRENIMQWFAHV
jgi:hypothetical protein